VSEIFFTSPSRCAVADSCAVSIDRRLTWGETWQGALDEIRALPVRAGERVLRLGDIAEVRRGWADPAAPRMRFMGQDALGIEVAMKPGGDILKLGKALEDTFARLQKELPVGMTLSKVSDQPQAVRASVVSPCSTLPSTSRRSRSGTTRSRRRTTKK
jgi:multidrug efflux pump subunit AcrB